MIPGGITIQALNLPNTNPMCSLMAAQPVMPVMLMDPVAKAVRSLHVMMAELVMVLVRDHRMVLSFP